MLTLCEEVAAATRKIKNRKIIDDTMNNNNNNWSGTELPDTPNKSRLKKSKSHNNSENSTGNDSEMMFSDNTTLSDDNTTKGTPRKLDFDSSDSETDANEVQNGTKPSAWKKQTSIASHFRGPGVKSLAPKILKVRKKVSMDENVMKYQFRCDLTFKIPEEDGVEVI